MTRYRTSRKPTAAQRRARALPRFVTSALALLVFLPWAPAWAEDTRDEMISCEMTFSLNRWSAIYESGKGTGTITCDDGQTVDVVLRVKGAGLTVGKSRILDGIGRFSNVLNIEETLGSYAAAAAHAGVVESANATALTKGRVSLALAGTGQGFNLGLSFSRFKIKRKR